MAIHDVEMKPIAPRLFGAVDFIFETGEVRGEDRGSNEDFLVRHMRREPEEERNVQRATSDVQRSLKRREATVVPVTETRLTPFCPEPEPQKRPLSLDVGRWTLSVGGSGCRPA